MAASSVKNPFKWTKNATLHFTELLKQHLCIWDVKSKEYTVINITSTSLDKIKINLSDVLHCEVKREDIMKKLHTLKSQSQRERTALKSLVEPALIKCVF